MFRWLSSLFSPAAEPKPEGVSKIGHEEAERATSDDALNMGAVVQGLASVIYPAAQQAFGTGTEQWTAALLDVRFDDEKGSSVDQLRIEKPDGSLASFDMPPEAIQHLYTLGKVRPKGEDRWFGVLLRITSEGRCNAKLNYDSKCADDPAFYES
jgi:hypothetical protein